MKAASCSSCSAPIVFVPTAKSGGKKLMPLDAEPSANGTVRIVDGLAHMTGKDAPAPLYVPHWATCPTAAEHRKPRP